jgi:hypothetical protein
MQQLLAVYCFNVKLFSFKDTVLWLSFLCLHLFHVEPRIVHKRTLRFIALLFLPAFQQLTFQFEYPVF